MDIFKLNRYFWDYAFNNPEKIKPNHCAIYYFAIEHCNRLGWKQKFGFPTSMVLEATGIKSYSVYKKTFDDLVSFGLFEVISYSKNQYSSNIIALKENYKAHDKALDKAMIKHITKQDESTVQSIDSINKHKTINNKQITEIEIENYFIENGYNKDLAKRFYLHYQPDWIDSKGKKVKDWKKKAQTVWFKEENKQKLNETKFRCEDMNVNGFFYPYLTQAEFEEQIKTNKYLRKL